MQLKNQFIATLIHLTFLAYVIIAGFIAVLDAREARKQAEQNKANIATIVQFINERTKTTE